MKKYSVVPVLVDPAYPRSEVDSVLFSPFASCAVVKYQDQAPEFHDLRAAGLNPMMEDGTVIELNASSRSNKFRFRDPLKCLAFNPMCSQLALVFQGDDFVYRINPSNSSESYEPIYCEKAICLAFDSSAELLAVASADCTVTVFRLKDDGGTEELYQVQLPSPGRAMVFDEASRMLILACENNSLVEVPYESDELPTSRGVDLFDGQVINAMQIKALDYAAPGLLVYAGVGNEVWLASSGLRQGAVVKLRNTTRIHSLQFGRKERILAFTDGGVRILNYTVNADGLPQYLPEADSFNPIEGLPMVGAHHYGSVLCVASVLPPE